MMCNENSNRIWLSVVLFLCFVTCQSRLIAFEIEDKDSKIVEVVAEGVGVSKEAAEKDAYRQAIRQVVGMYVDARTVLVHREMEKLQFWLSYS